MANKKTKREFFEEIDRIASELGREDLVEFAQHELDLIQRKAEKRAEVVSVKKAENEELKQVIIDTLVKMARPVTIKEIQEKEERLAGKSNQKISAMLTQLVNNKVVKRGKDKKISVFSMEEG